MRSRSSCPFAKSSRAAAPRRGSSRIAGYLPLSSQTWKKNVDRRDELLERLRVDAAQAEERGDGEVLRAPLDRRPSRARLRDRHERLRVARGVLEAQALLLDAVLVVQRGAAPRVEERRDDTDDPRGIEDVHRRVAVLRRHLDGRVLA
jgi:hypothetical protein